jgi:hypothetical protein
MFWRNFSPEDGDSTFPQNADIYLTVYTVSKSQEQQHKSVKFSSLWHQSYFQATLKPKPRQQKMLMQLFVHTRSEAHPASYPMGTEGPFSEGNACLGNDADHSPPSSAKVTDE